MWKNLKTKRLKWCSLMLFFYPRVLMCLCHKGSGHVVTLGSSGLDFRLRPQSTWTASVLSRNSIWKYFIHVLIPTFLFSICYIILMVIQHPWMNLLSSCSVVGEHVPCDLVQQFKNSLSLMFTVLCVYQPQHADDSMSWDPFSR